MSAVEIPVAVAPVLPSDWTARRKNAAAKRMPGAFKIGRVWFIMPGALARLGQRAAANVPTEAEAMAALRKARAL